MADQGKEDRLVAVGRITGAHGIRGEVKVEILTDFPERFSPGSSLLLVPPAGEPRKVAVLSSRQHKGRMLVALEGVADRNDAEGLRGSWLKIGEDELTPLPSGRYYQFELLGLAVVTEEGEALGEVEEIMPTGGNLVLAVRRGGREVLLPFIDDVVLEVDLEARRMTVRLLEGLV